MPVKFINITEREFLQNTLLIHKYMPIERGLEVLAKKNFWFANPTEWHDPFESMFLTANYQLPNGNITQHPWQSRVFATCMTETSTSEAYWNVYSDKQIGLSFAISRQVLLKELMSFSRRNSLTIYIGKVEYQKSSQILDLNLSNNLFIQPYLSQHGITKEEAKVRLLLLKRSSYRYEDEIRFFVVKPKKLLTKGINVNFRCNQRTLIKNITIDPNVGDNVYKMIKNRLVSEYHFNPNKIKKSLLYTKPPINTFSI